MPPSAASTGPARPATCSTHPRSTRAPLARPPPSPRARVPDLRAHQPRRCTSAGPWGVWGRSGVVFLLLQLLILSPRLRWQHEGILGVAGVRDPMEGARPRLGGSRGTPGHTRQWGCGALRGLAAAASLLAVIGSEPQLGGYFWLCITSTAHAAALVPLSPPHAHAAVHAHPCAPPRPQTHTVHPGPVPTAPGSLVAPQPPWPHIKAAGGDAWWLSHTVASCQPQLGAAAPRAAGGGFTSPPPKLLERSYGGFCTAQR